MTGDIPRRRAATLDDAAKAACTFLDIARRAAANDGPAAADLLFAYFTRDQDTASVRLWTFASIGPVRGAAERDPGQFWDLADSDPGKPVGDPAALAAAQSVVRYLNDDEDAMHDIITAHFQAGGRRGGYNGAHVAMLHMVVHHLRMLASLMQAGAFEVIP
ncbi:hypothetical protein [Amycolatopsis sp. H20-H5]|uniref:hypothetical protein n=1 Tax=Amycolatopsis sp. H20-H5 TaxID=3046309 RepID=UPI002DB68A76|nr:hypothetical protein [Amycolatopsis sp. H20-H5]MEC3975102.1 hypothetical protein [Amycolatopsis sp. H20-H5]